MHSTLFVCVVWVITTFDSVTCFDRGSINLYKDESAKMSSQLVNQSRFDDVDVKVEVNVSGGNKTTPHQAHIKTDKEVLAKILGNPHSKEHVKAVKILRELVKTLKENKQKEKQLLLKNKTGVSFNAVHSRKPTSKKISKAKAKHTVHSSSSSKKQKHFKQKVKKIKKNQIKLHKTLPNKSSHNVTERLHLIKPDETMSETNMTVNEDNETEAPALELRANKSNSHEAHNKTTSMTKHIKEAFTTALKEAIIETTKNAIQGKLLNGSNFHSNLINNATFDNNTNNDINTTSSENASNEKFDDKNIENIDDSNNVEKIDDKNSVEKIDSDNENIEKDDSDNKNIENVDNNNKVNKKINSNKKNIEENVTANKSIDENSNVNGNMDENSKVNENMDENTNANKNIDENVYLNKNMEQDTNVDENMEENNNVNKNMKENTNINKNLGENTTVNKTFDENTNVNKSMEVNANLNKTSDNTLNKPEEKLENQTFSKYNNNDEKSNEKDTERVVPFTETTNVNVPVNNNTKVVTNIYKIIIHKNNSRELQGDEAQEYKGGKNVQDYRGSSIQSFTKIRNENESESDSGSANMEDEGNGDEEGDDEPEMEYKNANINRNKPSTMTGKTLTITFQENAQNLGGSSVTVKDPVLPGSSHLKMNRNESDDESMQKQQKTVTALVDDSLKLDSINTSELLLHDAAPLKPQKLFNDTLFEEAGIKANDKKQNKKDLSNVNLQNDKKSGTKPGLASLTTVKIDSNLGEDMDDNKNEGSGSGLSSGTSIGNEFFFSKNERLSDAIEGHEIKPLNNYQGMNDKRDLITASFKSFANSILSHQPFTFIGKRPGNKYSLLDRQKGSKKESINVKPKKRNLKKARITHKFKPQKDLFESAGKRNELKLHKFEKKNVSLEDMSWNGDASRYGSLVFKRNIVSEDDDIVMESDESSERFHKELIALNDQPSIVEAKDKIFQKSLLSAYRKRSQIPFREKIIAKREVQHKNKQKKKISVANSTRSLTSSNNNEENGSGEASGQNETGSKRLGIPKKTTGSGAGPHKAGDKRLSIPFTDDLDTMGDLDEDVETLYNFGTEANMHTNPIFNSEVDPMLKKLAEKTKLEKHKQDQAKEQSAFVQQIDPGVSTISTDEQKDALLTYKNEMELNNEERNSESDEDEGAINPAGASANSNIQEEETQISATGEMQLMDSASANPVAQMGEYAQPQGEARQSMMSEETEEENDAYPNSAEEHSMETTDDSDKTNNAFSPQATYKEKTKAGQSDRNKAAKEVMMAEKLLKAMEKPIPKLQMKARADQKQSEKTEEQEPLQRPSSRSDSSQILKNDLKQSIRLIPKKKTGAAVHIVHSTAKANPKKILQVKTHQSKTQELKAKIVKATNKLKGVLTESDEVKTAYSSPALHLQSNQGDTVDDLSKRNSLKPKTKRHDSETQDFSIHNDIENEKAVATEADIPGVYAEKTDRKINRDFASDSVDTETIVDDVRKRTPKLKNDVSIDEGLDTSKRQNVKKTNPKRKTLTNDEEVDKLEKRQNFASDSDLQALRQHELQETFMPNGKLRGVDKNGFISSIKIVDSETSVNPHPHDEMLEYSEESKKADAEFDNEYNKK